MNVFRLKNKGFTLLEIIIVVIILAVLATLALPSFFSTIETSKGSEALQSITALRGGVERCYVMNNQALTNCSAMGNLDVADPGTPGQAHFTYAITTAASTIYSIVAVRKTVRGGVTTSTITYVVSPTGVTKSGTSAYSGIQ